MSVASKTFWTSGALLAFSIAGYPLALAAAVRLKRRGDASQPDPPAPDDAELPRVAMLVAAHDEEASIGGWVEMARSLDYPSDRLELVVAADGCADRTAERAREAGADGVLELERGGKVAALHAAIDAVGEAEVLAFSDANSRWRPEALRLLVARLGRPAIGYVCGRLSYADAAGNNQEGLYWRYETAIRGLESELGGITAGNGAINVVRRAAFLRLATDRGLDITLPFELAKRGWRAEYEPDAVAVEPMAATIDDEFGRKRRMLTGSWRTLLGTSMLSPRGYPPALYLEILSHRLLRYAAPLLHVALLGSSLAHARDSRSARMAAIAHLGVVALAAFPRLGGRVGLICRYYVTVTAASGLGLWDLLRRGAPTTWSQAEGTREP